MSAYESSRKSTQDGRTITVEPTIVEVGGGTIEVAISGHEEESPASPQKTQLEIYEVRTEDGGTGLQFGTGPIHMGYDAGDLMRLLAAVFPGESDEVDGDLYDLARTYLEAES